VAHKIMSAHAESQGLKPPDDVTVVSIHEQIPSQQTYQRIDSRRPFSFPRCQLPQPSSASAHMSCVLCPVFNQLS
jgi:hypothetical protein